MPSYDGVKYNYYKAGGADYYTWRQQMERQKQTKQIMSDWQSAYDSAKNANEQRYGEILQGYDDRYSNAMSGLQGMGQAELAEIQRAYGVTGSHQQQALVNSGLSSTSVRPAVMQQNASAMARAMSLVNERLQNQHLNLQTALSGDKLSFMERREDEYPDMGFYLELLKQAGNYAS